MLRFQISRTQHCFATLGHWNKQTNNVNEQKLAKNPNWWEADKLAIHTKRGGVESDPSSGKQKDLNPGASNYKMWTEYSAVDTYRQVMFQLVFFCQDLLLFPVDFIFQGSLVIQFIFGALNLRVKPENTAIQP